MPEPRGQLHDLAVAALLVSGAASVGAAAYRHGLLGREALAAEREAPGDGAIPATPRAIAPIPALPRQPAAWAASVAPDRAAPDALPFDLEAAVVARARLEVTRGVGYENGYLAVSGYPMGDIRADKSACTDVVVRSLRAAGIDLQRLVHEDVLAAPEHYKLRVVDTNIDHRRIGTMHAFFARNALSLSTDVREKDAFRPGDIVFFSWGRGASAKLDHVGVVSDRVGPRGYRLVLENGGPHAAENDSLDRGSILAHFRAISRPAP